MDIVLSVALLTAIFLVVNRSMGLFFSLASGVVPAWGPVRTLAHGHLVRRASTGLDDEYRKLLGSDQEGTSSAR